MMVDKRLLDLIPESKKTILLSVLLKWISLISNIVMIFSIAKIIERRGCFSVVNFVVLISSLILIFFCTVFLSITSYKSSAAVKKTLRAKIYEKLLALGIEYQERMETAKVVQLSVEGVEQLDTWYGAYVPQLLYSVFSAITLFSVISFMSFKMAVVLLVCVPLIPVSIVLVQKIAKKLLSDYWVQYSNLADSFLENLQGLTTLKIYNADEYKHLKMNQEAEHFRKVTMKVLSMQLNSIIIMDIVAYSGAGLGIIFALNAFYSGELSLENCFVCILLSADFFIPLRRLGSYFHTAMNAIAASNRIFGLLDEPIVQTKKQITNAGVVALEKNKSEEMISFENVSYEFSGKKVLENVNLKIMRGELISFVGKSGSGKSTAAKVLCGIYKRYVGAVFIDGIELSGINQKELNEKLIYISHRDWIFKGSIKETLLEGNERASEQEMWKVLEKVQLADFVKENGGLEMSIKEDAVNLSGGQKQRLSIARALMHDSQILIFDEATSNIDVESEEAIHNLIQKLKGKKTVIIISHRKENCLKYDRTFEFKNGKITFNDGRR